MAISRPEDLLLNTEDNLFSLSNQIEDLINDLNEEYGLNIQEVTYNKSFN